MYVFGIYTNTQKDIDLEFTRKIASVLKSRNVEFYFDSSVAKVLQTDKTCDGKKIDILIVLGGDGTMLTAARKYATSGTMLFGLNMGRLGFLLDTELVNLEKAIDGIINDNYRVEKRIMLEASVLRQDGSVRLKSYALNEAVISQKCVLRMINVHVCVNELPVDDWRCDGLIISTPTGSTGYSLSAGGSVVFPTVDVLLITPICPHTLQSSNIVISGNDVVTVNAESEQGSTVLMLDGQSSFDVQQEETIQIKKADFSVDFIRFTDKNFFLLLKEKLAEWVIKE